MAVEVAGVKDDIQQSYSEQDLIAKLPKLGVFPELIPFVAFSPWLVEPTAKLASHNKMKSDHSLRMAASAVGISIKFGFSRTLMTPFVEAAIAHDNGFVKVPNEIINKDAPLTVDELRHLRLHPRIAVGEFSEHSRAVVGLIETVHQFQPMIYPNTCTTDFYYSTVGYEDGLPELYRNDIPRLLSALDKYDALRDPERKYKEPMTREQACEAILSMRDTDGNLIYGDFAEEMGVLADVWEHVRLRELISQETPELPLPLPLS